MIGKVLPSVCIGMACLESGFGYGTDGSRLMYKHNAVFGQKVGSGKTATLYWTGKFFTSKTSEEYRVGEHTIIQAAFRAYDTLEQCVFNYYELLNTSLYARVKAGVDYGTQMEQIKMCGYMTSSTEVNSVKKIIAEFNLTQYDYNEGHAIPVGIKPETPSKYIVGKVYTLNNDLYVRDAPDGNKVKFEAITLDAKAHAKFDNCGQAILKKGTKVTCKEVNALETSTWMRIPSGWVCACNKKNTYIL